MSNTAVATSPVDGHFIDLLKRLEYGRTLDALDDGVVNLLRELAKAADLGTAKAKGALTLKVSMQFDDNGVLLVEPDVVITKPRHKRAATVLFADMQGNIIGVAPQQLHMFPADGLPAETADASVVATSPAPAPVVDTVGAMPTATATPPEYLRALP